MTAHIHGDISGGLRADRALNASLDMSAPYIGALANRDFVKMNGLGNEIVVVDLRGAPQPIEPAAARAAARQERYDQLMALYPARGNADAAVRIYNSDGSEAGACGNGMRCVAALVAGETGRADVNFETAGGIISCRRAGTDLFTVDIEADDVVSDFCEACCGDQPDVAGAEDGDVHVVVAESLAGGRSP